ncbi:peptidoglycan DD-metalloendopeptidase family protein [bacterium]|nr:peptidoglycan DD-metalloendopeptidase family protein [bacterium]
MKTHIKKIVKKLTILGVVLCLQATSFNAVFADETTNKPTETSDKVPVMTTTEHKQELFLIKLRQQLQNARTDYFRVDNNVDTAKEHLTKTTNIIDSLDTQIENMDYLIKNAQAKIRNVEKQIAQKENAIEVLLENIKIKKIEIENQKILLKEYLKLSYLQQNSFYDSSEYQNISVPKLLLANNNVGRTFKEIQYFSIMDQTGRNLFDRLEKSEQEYKNQHTEITQTKQKLAKLNSQLEDEKVNLKLQQNAKKKFLEKTKGKEKIYRQLIAESKQEQLQVLEDINELKKNLLFVEQKIKEEGKNFNPDDYGNLITPSVRAIYNLELDDSFVDGGKLNWPIPPIRGISAYFHDKSYFATFGIQHNAIDIPTPQGTPIRAPLSGVVYKVKFKGNESYAYVILAHRNGIQTVYGHVSQVLVKEGDIVLPGEVIALSGATPGSIGAGYLTTGPHLHFEVIKGGKHINPLLVLPLDKLPEEYIPSYLKTQDKPEETSKKDNE